MPELELSAGVIDYVDTGGPGEPVVLVHGLGFDESVWDAVTEALRDEYRVLVPVLPLGSHRRPMRAGADLSPRGVARLLGEFLELLDLRGVTLVQNDAGTAQLLAADGDERIGRLVLTSCEALTNYPPGVQGKSLYWASKVPGGLFLLLQAFRVPALWRMPTALGGMAKRPIPAELVRRWYGPLLSSAAVRRDFYAFCRATERGLYVEAGERLRSFDRPALVVWGAEDRMMPAATGRRLAELLPRGRYVEIPDARTLIPLDNPAALAAELRRFIAEHPDGDAAPPPLTPS
ncbi:Haloalkane dehalogenase [Streptomyces sp. RB5]|uniref:Haloalkane dehalogenase n=1 Tax=Streptomyces smaragdinus TaxID=2585196 RepID=A0A7K0CKD7_9ACTN|nr:alpha/beta hydrolase [Streptomyces smaragdinus]MQY13703.1 Haloalkane dehalogenase [Streptomyces smaragdinus]